MAEHRHKFKHLLATGNLIRRLMSAISTHDDQQTNKKLQSICFPLLSSQCRLGEIRDLLTLELSKSRHVNDREPDPKLTQLQCILFISPNLKYLLLHDDEGCMIYLFMVMSRKLKPKAEGIGIGLWG